MAPSSPPTPQNPAVDYPRDLVGYGRDPPHPQWPGQARIAVQFVLNYEEGGENCVLHGDRASEQFLSEIVGAAAYEARHLSMESVYEYGSRAGVWRILREFEKRGLPLTVFGVAMALQRHPDVARAFVDLGHEVACHGWRWIHYQNLDIDTERDHMQRAMAIFDELYGTQPAGWYTGRDSPNTRPLVVEHGGFLYDSDYYGDDLPFWTEVALPSGERKPHLVVPYTLDTNDMRFATPQGFNTGEHFESYLKDAFDVLYAEGETAPKMLSIGLHCRLIGRPGRFAALQRFLDYVQAHDRVWICRRVDIARHWIEHHPFVPAQQTLAPQAALPTAHTKVTLDAVNTMSVQDFVALLGGVFEKTPWVAEQAARHRPYATPEELHAAMVMSVDAAGMQAQLALIRAHPELAGKAAIAGDLTVESKREQAGAGLDQCSAAEYARLHQLNDAYNLRFGHPFILAVRGYDRYGILAQFERRLENDAPQERQACLQQIYRIAAFRLQDIVLS